MTVLSPQNSLVVPQKPNLLQQTVGEPHRSSQHRLGTCKNTEAKHTVQRACGLLGICRPPVSRVTFALALAVGRADLSITQLTTTMSISFDKFEHDEISVDHAEAMELPVAGVTKLLPLHGAGNTMKLVESGWWWPGGLEVGK